MNTRTRKDTDWTSHRGWKIGGAVLATIAGLATIVGVIWQIAVSVQPTTTPTTSATSAETNASTTPESSVAERAATIHAGFPAARIDELFGGAIATRTLEGAFGWTEQTYAAENIAATAVVDESGTIVLYSVLVCEPDASAEFQTPSGSVVVLQGPPIGESEHWNSTSDPNLRALSYLEGGTGSSLGHLIEESVVPQASGNGWKTHLVGINRACGDTAFMTPAVPGSLEYFGSLEGAPADLLSFRQSTPANFYTEIAQEYRITDDTTIDFMGQDGDALGAFANPYVHDLPPGFAASVSAG